MKPVHSVADLKNFLEEKADFYNTPDFIENDPVSVPHRFSVRQDIEIAGFLAATISWGNRKSILTDAEKILTFLDHAPFDFVRNFRESDLQVLNNRNIHRTFQGEDLAEFLRRLQHIYRIHDSMEPLFYLQSGEHNFYHALHRFRESFLGAVAHRSHKHVSSTYKNSSAKRLMMFLRWMVRRDRKGVDFGIWKNLDPAHLSIPLDVHTGNISRKLNLIQRRQNDWKTVEELDAVVRSFNPQDPAVFDFALFGLGVSADF